MKRALHSLSLVFAIALSPISAGLRILARAFPYFTLMIQWT